MTPDVFLNKKASILRCLQRLREKYSGPESLDDLDTKEIILLNLQRACEGSIDLAMHVVAEKALGIPQGSRDAFSCLEKAGLIDSDLSLRMQHMVGFRNIAIHQYQDINDVIVSKIMSNHLVDFESFLAALHGEWG